MKCKKFFYLFLATILIYILFGATNVYGATKITYDGNNIDEAKYPGYKALLDNMKNQYGYNIELYYTDLDWEEALTIQYQGHGKNPKSLFYPDKTKKGLWYCPICGEANYDTEIPCASIDAIAYMLDPRNSLSDESIYQFMNFEGSNLTKEQIALIVKDTFLDNQEVIDAIYDTSTSQDPEIGSNLNAAFLIAKIIIEQGSDGSVLSNGTGYNGNYVGVYNYFNFGATGATTAEVINGGLSFAQESGWTTRRAAIIGGAKLIRENYVDGRAQNTFYFLKYNYSGKEVWGSMQYEQNIMGAESKGGVLRKYYKKINDLPAPTMIIPLYENMPKEKVERPSINKRSSLTYEEGVVTNAPSGMKIRAKPHKTGYHITSVLNGSEIKIIKRAENVSSDNFYWDLILTKDGTYGYAARIVGGDMCLTGNGNYVTVYGRDDVEGDGKQVIATSDGVIHMTPNVLVEDIKTFYPTAIVKAVDGNEMTSGVIGTYSKVEIDGITYTVSKRGDVDGDGYATILDVIKLFNHSKEIEKITDPIRFQAGRVTNGAKITILDVTKLLNYVKGTDILSL